MQLNAYLNFNGQCEAAFKFYEQALGGKILTMTRFETTPMAQQLPPEMRNKIIHARMEIGDTVLMASDSPPDRYRPPGGFGLSLSVSSTAEAEQKFNALAENGRIDMPMDKTFFAARFGMLKDRFGIPWMVICEKES
jgi:PhnB protein